VVHTEAFGYLCCTVRAAIVHYQEFNLVNPGQFFGQSLNCGRQKLGFVKGGDLNYQFHGNLFIDLHK
jgi:hypothetical protein